MMKGYDQEKIRELIRQHYSKTAKKTTDSCECPSSQSHCNSKNGPASGLCAFEHFGYSSEEVIIFHGEENIGLCCGNPLKKAAIKTGETVLDLGCGGGFDCYLAAKQVGKGGYVIGIDMTPEMVSKARKNFSKWDFENVEFRLGEIENLPVADNSVDVIISNCVINLSPDKRKVFMEAFRVLKPKGRLAISDIVATTTLPEEMKHDPVLYVGCIAGAISIEELENILIKAGFQKICIKPIDSSREFIREWVPSRNVEDFVVSATIEAKKP